VNVIKIDKSFVQRMSTDGADDLASNLGLEAVAEVVETRETWGPLSAQMRHRPGIPVARPVPGELLGEWLAASRSKSRRSRSRLRARRR
jgi:EAL domain-containing protein (putative c-di-GMP-specific phosphodiesterase class I)